MDEKKMRTVEEYGAKILGKMVDLEKAADILRNENSSEADKIKAIAKYFKTASDDFGWSYHTFIEALGNEI